MELQYFRKLLSAEKKRINIQCRIDFLSQCKISHIIPYGLQISKSPQLGLVSDEFRVSWNDNLCKSSVGLLELCIRESRVQLRQSEHFIENITNEIIEATSLSRFLNIRHDVERVSAKHRTTIESRHREKLKKFQKSPWIKSLAERSQPNVIDWWDPPVSTNVASLSDGSFIDNSLCLSAPNSLLPVFDLSPVRSVADVSSSDSDSVLHALCDTPGFTNADTISVTPSHVSQLLHIPPPSPLSPNYSAVPSPNQNCSGPPNELTDTTPAGSAARPISVLTFEPDSPVPPTVPAARQPPSSSDFSKIPHNPTSPPSSPPDPGPPAPIPILSQSSVVANGLTSPYVTRRVTRSMAGKRDCLRSPYATSASPTPIQSQPIQRRITRSVAGKRDVFSQPSLAPKKPKMGPHSKKRHIPHPIPSEPPSSAPPERQSVLPQNLPPNHEPPTPPFQSPQTDAQLPHPDPDPSPTPSAPNYNTTPNASTVTTRSADQPTSEPGFLYKSKQPISLRADEFFNVINLTDRDLTDPELRLLSKGLNFTPLPPNVDRLSLRQSVADFERNLRLAEFFHCDSDSASNFVPKDLKFREKSTWTPPANRDKHLDSYISVITSKIMSASENRAFSNLKPDEREALRDLKSRSDIVIRDADKGSATVIMDRQRYIDEGLRQLNDDKVYRRVPLSTIPVVETKIATLCDRLLSEGLLTPDMHKHAICTDTKPARFYLLPKVHKTGVPGRPVVSACGSATEGLSEIVDHFLQPFIPGIPSYIKDTDDFLRKIRAQGPLPPGSLLVTIDVTALYPSIPHHDGISALRTFLSERQLPPTTIDGICDMCELVLKNNVFEFNKEYFLQTSGTAIGTKMAPSYANIFLSVLERDLLNSATHKPEIYHRFIDDIFMVWTHGEQKLLEFLDYINSAHPTIKFTSDYSAHSINFLDVQVSISEDGEITTDLYTKPTDTHQYLQATSCHPNHTKRGIPYSQALRILRICSDLETAKKRCDELTNNLTRRGYNKTKVRQQVQRALDNFMDPPPPRANATSRQLFFTADYHPALPDIKGILTTFLPVLHESDKMKEILPSPPTMSFRQPTNLKKSLCRAKLKQPEDTEDDSQPAKKCGKRRCQICNFFECCDFITSATNKRKFKCRNRNSSCDSLWVIYVISCPKCNMQYVGQTNNFRLRMNGHKSDFRLHNNGRSDKTEAKALYTHLASCGKDTFRVQIVDTIDTRGRTKEQLHKELNKREREWIWKLDSISPKGLNTDDGFYTQNKKSRDNANR